MEVREIKKLIPPSGVLRTAFIFLLLVVSYPPPRLASGDAGAGQLETIASLRARASEPRVGRSGVEDSALRKESQGLSELISGGEVTIYYDYIENGQLKGGVVTTSLTVINLDSLIGPLSEWPVTTIIDNGPVSNRIDLVFVGDGYTASELGSYATHVQNIVSGYFAEEPMAAYAGYFNVHRVDVVSNESGVD